MKLPQRMSRRSAVRFTGVGALVGALGGTLGRAAAPAAAMPGNEIVGSWDVQPNDPIGFVLQTYTIDGGIISTHGQHLMRTPGHGAWVRTAEGRFLAEIVNYGFTGGGVTDRQVVTLDIAVDPSSNRYTANFTREQFDLAGNSLNKTVGTQSAVRILPPTPQ